MKLAIIPQKTAGVETAITWLVVLALILIANAMFAFSDVCRVFGTENAASDVYKDPNSCANFSATTWATIGYGDLFPTPAMRPFAAIEGLVAYVFMGLLLVGVIGLFSILPAREPVTAKEPARQEVLPGAKEQLHGN